MEDADLLEAWRAGDEGAGRELFARHFDAIFRFFRNKVDDAAEDLTQQTFLGCVRGADNFRRESSFRTYLFAIARNRLYTHIRDRGRKDARIADFGELGERSIADMGMPSPSGVAAAREEHRLLLTGLRRLPLQMQIALELHYWEGLSVSEIAAVTDTPSGTIKRRLQRGRARLAEVIEELANSPELAARTTAGFDTWIAQIRDELSEPSKLS